jgi:hypothetical protein
MSDTTYTPPQSDFAGQAKDLAREKPSQSDLAGQAKDVAREIREKAADLTGNVTRAAKDQAAQLGDAAKDLASDTASKVQHAVSQQKSAGADYIGSIAEATQRAAGQFDDTLPQAARYIRQASEHMQGMADVVRAREVRELVGEVENFARRQPALFFGGAVILGFAALRFLKSSAPQSGARPGATSGDAFEQYRAG